MFFSVLKDQPLYQKLSAYYSGMDYREQLLVNSMTIFLVAFFVITQVIVPSINFKEHAKQRYQSAQKDLQWMRQNLPSRPASQVVFIGGDQSMITKVSGAAKSTQLMFKRYDTLDDDRLRVVIERQSFKQLLVWLQYLEKNYAISVVDISVEKEGDTGFVNARVLLQG